MPEIKPSPRRTCACEAAKVVNDVAPEKERGSHRQAPVTPVKIQRASRPRRAPIAPRAISLPTSQAILVVCLDCLAPLFRRASLKKAARAGADRSSNAAGLQGHDGMYDEIGPQFPWHGMDKTARSDGIDNL
ncbi:uncharacterized protein L969DRAFT_94341 [Mixia osmundae IAM 14324]|uniref:Uncharacterized protein n=1 Tax=Mixia osmundae (strain CBS 9802 / IAM 14324 / JCM 22182 / KY 12970) TaxID=764103 RepID=G7DZR5_MIXOS|nr:uncharacterized protein L969DRAFT_94341 [Mixia osmundae IAM 14324]KEI39266.1 hypothetical protein L969DRAFT_94341 [Mixia osmundae IAM 14324]GAA96075.1 hypothetical protein E5Q_02736 [Mixia osmundae IAM 14324]